MNLLTTDRRSIECGLIVRTRYIVISVRDPERRRPRIRQTAGFHAVLYLAFHDAEPVSGYNLPRNIRLITPRIARAIWRFVRTNAESAETIVCHCEQGMSRSPAIAVALAEALGEDSEQILRETQPNKYVLELLRATVKTFRSKSDD